MDDVVDLQRGSVTQNEQGLGLLGTGVIDGDDSKRGSREKRKPSRPMGGS